MTAATHRRSLWSNTCKTTPNQHTQAYCLCSMHALTATKTCNSFYTIQVLLFTLDHKNQKHRIQVTALQAALMFFLVFVFLTSCSNTHNQERIFPSDVCYVCVNVLACNANTCHQTTSLTSPSSELCLPSRSEDIRSHTHWRAHRHTHTHTNIPRPTPLLALEQAFQ